MPSGPVIAFIVTKRLCLSLQRADRERVLHGSESGIIVRSPAGGYHEPHVPISTDEAFALTQHRQYTPLEETPSVDEHGVRTTDPHAVSGLRARLSAWYTGDDIAKPTAGELTAASHHGAHGSHGPSINGDGVDGHELDGPRHGSEAGVGAGSGADKAGLHH